MPRAARALAVAVAALAALAAAPSALASSSPPPKPPGDIAGRTVIERGSLIYTDYLYDAWGPDLDGTSNPSPFPSSAGLQTSGDYRYPDDPRYALNGADLRELRLKLTSKGIRGRISLETMVDPSVPIASVAIDTDGDSSTGQGIWPDGAGITTPGADAFVTVWGDGARATSPNGAPRPVKGGAKTAKNQLDFFLPQRDYGRKLAPNARVWAGVGLAGGAYYDQSKQPAVYDLAFQGSETFTAGSAWGDQRQAAALAAPSLSTFSTKLKPQVLADRRTTTPPLKPGFYNAIFRSDSDYGEGVSTREGGFGTAAPQFLGRYQPYGLYIPRGFKRNEPTQLLLALHSLLRNHNQYVGTTPDLLAQLGDERRSLIITPLARGADTWYLDSGLADTLEAWDDVSSNIAGITVDPGRTSLFGYSMGGYGSYRLGLLIPDRFARASTFVGPPAYVSWGGVGGPFSPDPAYFNRSLTNPLVPNALNLPFEINAGGADTLVNPNGVKAQAASFASAGNEYRFYFHPDANHFTFALDDVWDHTRDWLGNHRRVTDPRRVRFVRIPAFDLPDRGLVFDGAYWADGISLRDPSSGSGTLDATSFALGGREAGIVDEGTTELAPGQAGSTAATVTGQHPGRGPKLAARNGFSAALTNIGALTLDMDAMGLAPRPKITASLTGDGATTLRLLGPSRLSLQATLDGRSIPVRRLKRGRVAVIRLDLAAGTDHRLALKAAK